jgi:drug/metabolite transporter (DMT)-like permease
VFLREAGSGRRVASPVPLLLAALSSVTFGVADFAGGLATRRAPALTVVVGVYGIGLVGIVAMGPIFGGSPAAADLWWGVAAGAAGSLGLVLYYHALATTRMTVAAPVAAVVGALAPVVFGVVVGERPVPLAWVGIAFALPALLLIGAGGRETRTVDGPARAVVFGVVTGTMFGLFGIFISRSSADSGMWPLVTGRLSSTVLMVAIALAFGRPLIAPRSVLAPVVLAGVLDIIANVMFLAAVRMELLSLVAVIMAMYPASTVALARIVLGERVDRVQAAGMALAVVALTLIMLA